MSDTALTDIDSRAKELRAAWQARETENNEIVASAKIDNGVMVIDNARREAFQRNLAEMKDIRAQVDMLAEQKEAAEWGRQPADQSVALAAQAALAGGFAGTLTQAKTIGEMFVESPEFKQLQESGGLTMNNAWWLKGVDMLRHAEQKDVYNSLPTGDIPGGFAPVQREAMVPRAMRKMRVRDLFPVRRTTAGIIEYFRVTGFVGSSAASVVPDYTGGSFGLKPHTNLDFVGVQAPIRTIAHWEAAHRNVLQDVPQLQAVIDTELMYGLRLAEDRQILNGSGTGEEMLGILNTPGIQNYSHVGGDNKADDVRRAATKAILAFYEPTGVVLHPNDWEDIELLKDTQGAYIVAIAVAIGAEARLWRLPVVDTPAIAEGTGLVGSFGIGATYYDRQEANIRIAEQHADFFLRNAVVVLAEERGTVTVPRPESFVKIAF